MPRTPLVLACLALALGCGKKPAPPAANPGGGDNPAAEQSDRDRWLAALKTGRSDARQDAADALAELAEEDAEIIPALVEALKDKTNAGPGKTFAAQVNSTREAAVIALLRCGPEGEAALRDKGYPILRTGLADPNPAVREHTAYTIGLLGPKAKTLAPDLQKLCTDPDPRVRTAAFDALRSVGVADPVALAALLNHQDPEVARPAAELVPVVTEMPAEAVPPLAAALGSEDELIRSAAAEGLAAAGPKAAPAAPQLVEAIKRHYPEQFDPMARSGGSERAYWVALARIGEPAVAPAAGLLGHPNTLVRALAARTLGEIGPPAKSAAPELKKALSDRYAEVAFEAASALCRIGEGQAEAVELVRRALDADDRLVPAAAIGVIPRMGEAGKPLVPLALAKLADPNPNTRYAAVRLVGALDPAEGAKAAAEVAKLAADPFPEIRRQVGLVLEKLGPAAAPAAGALGGALAAEKDELTRDQFVDALVAMGPGAKPALPALVPLIGNPDVPLLLRVKVATAAAVADPASPEVAAALVKGLDDPDPTLQAAAARALAKLDPLPPDAVAALVKLAKSTRPYGPRAAALRALAEAGTRVAAAKADLDALAAGPIPGLATWAKVARIAADGDVTKAAPVVRAGLTDKNPQVRATAAGALELVGGPDPGDLPPLLRLLREPNPATKEAAAHAVGRLGPGAKDAVPRLARLLSDKDSEVRVAAAEALGRIGPAALPAAAKLREASTEPLVAAAARKALDRIGVKDEPPLR
jgi:HEAT repeat protein